MRRLGNLHHVTNLESYLIGAFRYRFQRALLKERRYRQKFLLTESIENLESLGRIQDWKPVQRLERELQVQQALKLMDPWTRRVWNYVKYGYPNSKLNSAIGGGSRDCETTSVVAAGLRLN